MLRFYEIVSSLRSYCDSQTALAHLIDVPSQSKISAWESEKSLPDVIEAKKLAQIFGLSLDDFLREISVQND